MLTDLHCIFGSLLNSPYKFLLEKGEGGGGGCEVNLYKINILVKNIRISEIIPHDLLIISIHLECYTCSKRFWRWGPFRHIYNYLGKYINLPVTSTAQTTNTFPFIADRLLKFHSSYKYIQVSTTLMTRSLYFFLSFSLSDFIYIYKFLLTKHKDRIRPISQTVASDSEEFPTVPQ